MASEMILSVALVTRNRPEQLERCLRSLSAAAEPPEEVVVSDDSDEAFAPSTREVAETFGCRYVRGPRRGLYANRNHAASQCRGTHVRTVDDDHEFPTGHWRRVRDAIAADPEAVWVIGEYYGWAQVKEPVPVAPEVQPRGFSLPPRNPDASMAISDGATVYPRRVFAENRMLERFVFGSVYLEFGARLKARGYRIRHLPTTYIIHHSGPVRSYDLPLVQVQTAFLAAALTYGVYFPSWRAILECWGYFTLRALANQVHLLLKGTEACKDRFGMVAWWKTAQLYLHYRALFLSGAWARFT
ncbi:MAG: glycosyltransferase family 2 protein [Verrucomicrobia bacterium]|nr:glycosyltransferase family 2 protein [Verrucomicrobiota bacterium]